MRSIRSPEADEGNGAGEQGARRMFRAADGVVWSVRERDFAHSESRATGRSLVFESDMIIRRVRRYPAGWRGLPDEELERLSWAT